MSASDRVASASAFVARCEDAIEYAADRELPGRSLSELARCKGDCREHPRLHAAFHIYEDAKWQLHFAKVRAEREDAAIEAALRANAPVVEVTLW